MTQPRATLVSLAAPSAPVSTQGWCFRASVASSSVSPIAVSLKLDGDTVLITEKEEALLQAVTALETALSRYTEAH